LQGLKPLQFAFYKEIIYNKIMDELTVKQKIYANFLKLMTMAAIAVCSILLEVIIAGIIIIILFAIINTILEFMGKKQHAEKVKRIKGFYMCCITSVFLLFGIMAVVRVGESLMPQSTALLLGAIVVVFCTFSIGDIFYFKPSGQTRYQKEIDTVRAILENSNHPLYNDLLAHEKLILYEGEQYMHDAYIHMFKNGLTLKETARLLDVETTYVARAANCVQWGLKTLFK